MELTRNARGGRVNDPRAPEKQQEDPQRSAAARHDPVALTEEDFEHVRAELNAIADALEAVPSDELRTAHRGALDRLAAARDRVRAARAAAS